MTNWTTTRSDAFVYSPPTLKDWRRWGYQLGDRLELWQSRKKHSRRAYHRCGLRLTVADAVFGVGPTDAEVRFVVVCNGCGLIWDTGINADPDEGDSRMGVVADQVAIEAAISRQENNDENKTQRIAI